LPGAAFPFTARREETDMKSRAIVFVALVLLVAPLSFMKLGRRHRHRPVEQPPPVVPESPLENLGR
jgi:hypothetical protein